MELFKLLGTIAVNNEEANNSIDETTGKVSTFGEKLQAGITTAAKWGTAIVGGATAIASGLTMVATNAAASADEVDKMSAKIGLSKQGYQEWSYVLGQNGMDISSLQMGIKTLVTQMDGAVSGTESSVAAFESLGLSVLDANGNMKDQETMMTEVILALANMENGTEKAKLANELFGRSGSELMPMLNGGSAAILELTQRSHDLGLIMTDEAVASGVVLGDTMDDVKQSVGMLVTDLGVSLMPILQTVCDLIIANLPMIQGLFSQLSPIVATLFSALLPPLLELGQVLLPTLIDLFNQVLPLVAQIMNDVLPVITELLVMLLPPLVEIVSVLLPPLLGLLSPLLELLSPLLQLLQPILDLVVGILQPISQLISGLLTPLISVISKLIQMALVPLQGQFSALSGLLSGAVNGAFSLVMNGVNTVKGVFNGLTQFIKGVFTGNWKSAWEGVKKVFSSIWDGIKTAFKTPINWIIDGINTFIRGINKIKIPDWVPAVGGKGFSIKEIPRLEKGGILEKGQVGLLEGNGAEAVVPLDQNQAWISAIARDMKNVGIGGHDSVLEQYFQKLIEMLSDYFPQIVDGLDRPIAVNPNSMAAALVVPMNQELGRISARKDRGR